MQSRRFRFLVTALCAALVWTFAAAGAAFAAEAASAEPPESGAPQADIECHDGVCALHVDLGAATPDWLPGAGFWINVVEDNLHVLPDGAGLALHDDVVLEMPVGNIHLAGVQMNLELDENNQVKSFHGTAEVPLPSLPLLGNVSGRKPAAAGIHFDRGDALAAANLSLTDAPLVPDRKYLSFDLASGSSLTAPSIGGAGDLRLDIPQGQRALVVIDPQERFAYIDGHVTLRYNGELMFLAQLLDPTEVVDLFAGELPLRHQATVHVTGALTDRLDASHLELAGRYAVDGGRVGEWLKLDGEPLALEGSVTLTPAGLLATGVVRSSIAPQQVLDSAVQAQVFIPFSGDVQDAYVEVRSRLDVPVVAVHADAMARLDGDLETVAEANMSAPWNSQDATALIEAGVAGVNAAEEVAQANAESEPGRWARTVDAVAGSTRTGYGRLAELASAGWDVTASSAQQSAQWSAEMAARGWCGVSGRCDTLPLEAPMETAMR